MRSMIKFSAIYLLLLYYGSLLGKSVEQIEEELAEVLDKHS